jgi:tyrosyl-tRNA synthetase
VVNALDVLRGRGFVQDVSNEAGLRATLERPTTLYDGFDPTRDTLQVGNLVGIMMLAHLQRCGHRPIVLLGGGTAMIGDPSGKTEMRETLTFEQIERNARGVLPQFARYIDFSDGRALLLNNAEWLLQLDYIPFLRDIGRYFSVNQLLQHETYRERLAGQGLSFIELNYALVQAYDFLYLHREYGCQLQVGGSDQWFNILAGVDLIRRVTGKEAFALVSPLISAGSGAKMGKTEAGAVWLDAKRTSPYEFYQYWRNTDDADVERFLKMFTFIPVDEIRRLSTPSETGINEAKEVLALEVTRLTHGDQAAGQARAAATALFRSGGGDLDSVPTTVLSTKQLEAGLDVVEALVQTGLAPSRTTGKAQVQGGGVYVNEKRVEGSGRLLTPADIRDGGILLRRGKKEYRRIVVS